MMQMNDYKEVPQNDAVVRQPGAGTPAVAQGAQWMSIPVGIQNCPQGLEYLSALDQLLIAQKVEMLEAITGGETKNKYKIKNSLGQNVYFAAEDSSWLQRSFVGASRELDFKIMDNFQNEVLHIHRPAPCPLLCCFPECLNQMEVSAPPGHPIGTIQQVATWGNSLLHIKNSVGDVILTITMQGCGMNCFGDRYFQIINANNDEVGRITKQWSGLAKELFTDADYFSVTFPLSLDVRMKALVLSAVLLIDMMFYEN